jgi:hypothetical protein
MQILGTALAGVHAAEARMEKSARALATAGMPEDQVDLSAEMIALIEVRSAVAVNVKVAQTGEEIERVLLGLGSR